jgi:hypothetical protein
MTALTLTRPTVFRYNASMEFHPENDSEAVLATVAQSLAFHAFSREVEILVYGQAKFKDINWEDGDTVYSLDVWISAAIYEQVNPIREQIEKNILSSLQDVFRRYDNEFIAAVRIYRDLNTNPNWKVGAQSWLRGENVNNQGRVRSDNIAPLEKDGLLFRSIAEIHLYDALKRLEIPIAPLPVFVQGGRAYQRIEPDLLVVNQGLVMVVEIDGDTYHTESPATAAARLEVLTSHGIQVKRVNADECSTPESAATCAQGILEYMAKLKTARV